MKADPGRQWRLLDLQALDTRLAQIAHRRRTLPEAAEHDRLQAELDALASEVVRARTACEDVQREITKADADVQQVRDRAARNRSRLDAGQGSPKDLEALQHELTSLGRRQNELEDLELDVMERAEGLQVHAEELTARHGELTDRVRDAQAARDAVLEALDAEAATIDSNRADVVAGVGADLYELYEKIRAQSGVGAAALTRRRCDGCHLELLGADLRRVAEAPPDEVVRCEECRRILVRTAESGL